MNLVDTGNKGAVAIRFNLFGSSFCFVNAHLAAHRENNSQRNSDYHRIISKMQFRYSPFTSNAEKTSQRAARVLDHDYIFFLGDLNFRLNLNDEKLWMVYSNISRKEWGNLIKYDQLNAAREEGACFTDFEEAIISFPPTFKYMPKTDDYATGDGKNRMPAWCDRILWKATEKHRVEQCFYKSTSDVVNSDHKPVTGSFSVLIPVPNLKNEAATQIKRLSSISALNKRLECYNEEDMNGSFSSIEVVAAPSSPQSDSTMRASKERNNLFGKVIGRKSLSLHKQVYSM